MSRFFKILSMMAFVLMVSQAAAFAEGKRSGTHTNRAGKTTTWEKNVERNKGSSSKDIKWKNARGGEGSSEVKRTWDKESKSGTLNRTTTNAQGKTITGSRTFHKNDDGSIAIQGTQTGPKGNTMNTNSTLTKTDNGWTREGTYSGSQGKSGSFTREGTRTEDGRSVTSTRTNNQGQTWHREAEIVRDGEGNRTRSVTQTNPQGQTRTWWSGVTVQPGYATNN